MPGKPRGERALTDAERQARRRLRIAEEQKVAWDALAFLLNLAEAETYSMTWETRKRLRDLQTQARIARAFKAV